MVLLEKPRRRQLYLRGVLQKRCASGSKGHAEYHKPLKRKQFTRFKACWVYVGSTSMPKPPCGDPQCSRHKLTFAKYALLAGRTLTAADKSALSIRAAKLFRQLYGKDPKPSHEHRRLSGNNPVNIYPCGVLQQVCASAPQDLCTCRETTAREFMTAKGVAPSGFNKKLSDRAQKLWGVLEEQFLRDRRERPALNKKRGAVRKHQRGILEQAYAQLIDEGVSPIDPNALATNRRGETRGRRGFNAKMRT